MNIQSTMILWLLVKLWSSVDWNETANALVDLPLTCLDNAIVDTIPNLDNVTAEDLADANVDVDNAARFVLEIRDKVVECAVAADLVGKLIAEVTLDVGLLQAFSSPTFDWIRWYVSQMYMFDIFPCNNHD